MTDDELAESLRPLMHSDSFKYDPERIKDVVTIVRATLADEQGRASST